MSSEPTVTIEWDGHWWNWTVELGRKNMMGCDRTFEGAAEAMVEAHCTIKSNRKNPPRNP